MIARRLFLFSTVALALGAGGCGGTSSELGADGESVVVIHLNLDANVPELHQIHVAAHLGSADLDSDNYFPVAPRMTPIASGETLALLIPPTRMGLLDLIVFGLDGSQNPVARGNGQTTISVGDRVDVYITLNTCTSSGPGSGC